jgi:thiol-disulfide isomerase/thioredoxin
LRSSVLASIILVIAVAAGLGGYYALEQRGGGALSPTTTSVTPSGREVALPLHKGDVFVFNATWIIKTPVGGSVNTTKTTLVEEVTVNNLSVPYLLSVGLKSGNNTGSGSLPYGLLALPRGDLGSPTIVEPVITPLGGVCMKLQLTGNSSWSPRGWRSLRYEGSLEGPGYKLFFEALYNASNGVVLEANSTAWLISSPSQITTVTLRLVLANYRPSGGEALEARLPSNAFCAPAASSDLRLCADGFYVIRNGVPAPVNGSILENASEGPSVVVILNKYCPHCQRFWPSLLNASTEVKAPVYTIIFSGNTGLSNPVLSAVLRDVLEKAGLEGQGLATPSVIVFPGPGRTPAYRAGEMSPGDFASWVNTVLQGSS